MHTVDVNLVNMKYDKLHTFSTLHLSQLFNLPAQSDNCVASFWNQRRCASVSMVCSRVVVLRMQMQWQSLFSSLCTNVTKRPELTMIVQTCCVLPQSLMKLFLSYVCPKTTWPSCWSRLVRKCWQTDEHIVAFVLLAGQKNNIQTKYILYLYMWTFKPKCVMLKRDWDKDCCGAFIFLKVTMYCKYKIPHCKYACRLRIGI